MPAADISGLPTTEPILGQKHQFHENVLPTITRHPGFAEIFYCCISLGTD